MSDIAIFAKWPRGLYLAKKLSEEGHKINYIEVTPREKNPFGIFIDQEDKEIKELFESLGFLFQQEGGFCVISPQGIWSLQDMGLMSDRLKVLKNKRKDELLFKDCWISHLSLNFAGKVFEYNDSEFSDQDLNLFSDYFVFKSSVKKWDQFQKDHPQISFYSALSEEILFEENLLNFSLKGTKTFKSQEIIWLLSPSIPHLKGTKPVSGCWRWQSYFFKLELGDYEGIIPSHFISLGNVFFPWSHDNLLSVFYESGVLEVWIRSPYKTSQRSFEKEIRKHLQLVFPGGSLDFVERKPFFGPFVYGPESLSSPPLKKKGLYIEDMNSFYQSDLASEIQSEKRYFLEKMT